MLISLKDIISIAEEGNFAIPAFNVYNTESIMGVAKAAEEAKAMRLANPFIRMASRFLL